MGICQSDSSQSSITDFFKKEGHLGPKWMEIGNSQRNLKTPLNTRGLESLIVSSCPKSESISCDQEIKIKF